MLTFSQRSCFTFVLFAFAGVILYLTFGLGRVARMVPFAVVVPTLLLLLFQLIMDLLPRLAKTYSQWEQKDLFQVEGLRNQVSQSSEDVESEALSSNRERNIFLWLLLMLILIYLFGFLIALPLHTLLYLKKRSENWLMALLIAVGIGGLVYAISTLDLAADLYTGFLWRYL